MGITVQVVATARMQAAQVDVVVVEDTGALRRAHQGPRPLAHRHRQSHD
jgi:hypothetical protein